MFANKTHLDVIKRPFAEKLHFLRRRHRAARQTKRPIARRAPRLERPARASAVATHGTDFIYLPTRRRRRTTPSHGPARAFCTTCVGNENTNHPRGGLGGRTHIGVVNPQYAHMGVVKTTGRPPSPPDDARGATDGARRATRDGRRTTTRDARRTTTSDDMAGKAKPKKVGGSYSRASKHRTSTRVAVPR